MDILQVEAPLVCTRRVKGLQHISLRVLRDVNGRRQVAVDPVGARTAIGCLPSTVRRRDMRR